MKVYQNMRAFLHQRAVLLTSIILLLLAVILTACKSDTPSGSDIQAEDVWSRPAMVMAMGENSGSAGSEGTQMGHAMAGTGAIFMKLVNTGSEADRLIGAKTDVAEVVEIHETTMQDEVMKMQMLPQGLELPAEGEVVLKPGGYHIMLIGIKHDLKVGDQIALVMEFEKSALMTVEAEVREP